MWSVLTENLVLAAAAVAIGVVTGWWALKPRRGGASGDKEA